MTIWGMFDVIIDGEEKNRPQGVFFQPKYPYFRPGRGESPRHICDRLDVSDKKKQVARMTLLGILFNALLSLFSGYMAFS